MGEVADKAQRAGQQAHHSEWLDWAIRAGLVAYGVVHLMVAWLAAQLALGEKSENASNSGALHALAEQPMGGVLIWMIAVGMLLLVVWRLLEFAMGYQDETDDEEALAQARHLARQGRDLRRPGLERVQGRRRRRVERRHRLHHRQAHGPARRAAHRRRRRARDHRLRRLRWSTAAGPRSSPSTSTPRASPARTARRTSCSARSATSPRASPSRSSAGCSATPRSPTTPRSPAASTRRCRRSWSSRSARCC